MTAGVILAIEPHHSVFAILSDPNLGSGAALNFEGPTRKIRALGRRTAES